MSNLQLTSPAFEDGEFIPKRFTCEGENISPPLDIAGVPEAADSFAVIVTDPDIPQEVKESMGIEVFDHWIAYNIATDTIDIAAGQSVGTEGINSSGELGYTGPCPPAEYEPTKHRYVFTLYALNTKLGAESGLTREDLEKAIEGHVLGSCELIGYYEKQAA